MRCFSNESWWKRKVSHDDEEQKWRGVAPLVVEKKSECLLVKNIFDQHKCGKKQGCVYPKLSLAGPARSIRSLMTGSTNN